MGSNVRDSGVRVATGDAVTVDDDGRLGRRLAVPTVGTPTSARRQSSRVTGTRHRATEEEALVTALAGHAMQLVDAIPFESTTTPSTRRAARLRRPKARSVSATDAPDLTLEVPLGRDQAAVVLLERDGVYTWQFAVSGDASSAIEPGMGPYPRRSASVAGARRYAQFEIKLPAQDTPDSANPSPRRGTLRKLLHGRAVALVFRFLAKPALLGTARFLERGVSEGLMQVDSTDPATWKPLRRRPRVHASMARPARVLLLVHGTFSSTVGSFGALAGLPEGRAWLRAALGHYDLILGWEHRTLSVLPSQNAEDLRDTLHALHFAQPPQLDAIAFSRGGMVLRSLIENADADHEPAFSLGRAVFVGSTLAGTELARPENWHRLCDRYTNLATAGVRLACMLPGAADPALLLLGALRGLGGLVKTLATSAVHDSAIPGLAAMDPAGAFVTSLNRPGKSVVASQYCAVTSSFDHKAAPPEVAAGSLPPGLLLRLADRGSDALLGEDSDLVVHVASMTRTGDDATRQILERHEFGHNSQVHHCAYFGQPQTVTALDRWLTVTLPETPASRSRGSNRKSSAPPVGTPSRPFRRPRGAG